MTAAVKVELRKLLSRRKYYVLLAIQLAACVVVVLATSLGGFQYWGQSVDVPAAAYAFLNGVCAFALPLICFMLCADAFAGEMENRTIRAALLRPVSRLALYLAKCLAIWLVLFGNLLATYAAVVLVKLITGSGLAGLWQLGAAFLLSGAPMFAFVALGALISLAVGHSSLAMFCGLALYAALQGVTLAMPKVGAMFFTSHLEWYKMFFAGGFTPGLANTLLMLAAYTALMGAGGAALFERYEA